MYTGITGAFLNSIQALRFYVDSVELKTLKTMENDDNNAFFALLMYAVKNLKIRKIDINDIDFPDEIPEVVVDNIKQFMEVVEDSLDVSEDGMGGRYRSIPKSLKESYRTIEAMQRQNEILYSGALMLLITYFENTISKILRADFQRHPGRMSLENKMVSYKMLELSASIDEVKGHLIENEVTSIMYKSVSDWIEYFKRAIKLKLEYVTETLPHLIEITARRNLIVYNEGVVNTIYLNSIKEKNSSKVKRGDYLRVDKEYIIEAINFIESVGMAIIVEMWVNEFAQDKNEIEKILAIIYDEYLIFEKWENAKILYDICLKSNKLQAADELTCKINRWQCYKWQGKFEEIRNEVEKLDVSACKPIYRLGIMALQDKYEEFFEYFEKQRDINKAILEDWPLFREIRESSIYIEKYKTDIE